MFAQSWNHYTQHLLRTFSSYMPAADVTSHLPLTTMEECSLKAGGKTA